MSKYILGSRRQVVDHLRAREHLATTLSAGGLVLFRAALLFGAMVLAWHYGLL
jgi:hypothetical protein